jgi:hypothetical protein
MEAIKYELKYCERCGTLKLRAATSGATYCRACERLLGRFKFHGVGGANCRTARPVSPDLERLAARRASGLGVSLAGRVQ